MERFCSVLFAATLFLSPSLQHEVLAQPNDGLDAGSRTAVTGVRAMSIVARGDSSSIPTLRAIAVNSSDEWRRLVPALSDRTDTAILRPPVNFAQQTIIAVFQGFHNDGGLGIQIEEIIEHSSRIVVATTQFVRRPHCTGHARHSPYEIVVVPKTLKRIELDTMVELVDCK